MKTYSPNPPPTFTAPNLSKFYLIGQGAWGIVYNLGHGIRKYKTFSALTGTPWASYEADTLEELFKMAHSYSAKIYEFDTMKELLEYVLKN
jgi:hypothetical protein